MTKPRHILVIRLSAMGDVAMTVPVLRVLTQNYPELKLTILSKRLFEPLFSDLPNVHFLEADVYGEHKGFLGLLKLSKEIKELRVDAVADLHNVIRSKVITRNLSLKGVQTASINKGRLEKKKLTNAKGLGLVQLKSTHQRYADVFEELGFSIDLSAHKPPKREPLNSRLHTLIGREPKNALELLLLLRIQARCIPWNLSKKSLPIWMVWVCIAYYYSVEEKKK